MKWNSTYGTSANVEQIEVAALLKHCSITSEKRQLLYTQSVCNKHTSEWQYTNVCLLHTLCVWSMCNKHTRTTTYCGLNIGKNLEEDNVLGKSVEKVNDTYKQQHACEHGEPTEH